MPAPRILAFAGSLRRDSFNKRLVTWAAGLAREAGAETRLLDLAELQLPLFNEDDERDHGLPAGAVELKASMRASDALLVATPEYNGSITAALKNAIDWASRKAEGERPLECFSGKTVALLAASPGALGGLRGLVHTRAIFGNLGCLVLGGQVAVGKAHESLGPDGELRDERLAGAVRTLVGQLVDVSGKLAS